MGDTSTRMPSKTSSPNFVQVGKISMLLVQWGITEEMMKLLLQGNFLSYLFKAAAAGTLTSVDITDYCKLLGVKP